MLCSRARVPCWGRFLDSHVEWHSGGFGCYTDPNKAGQVTVTMGTSRCRASLVWEPEVTGRRRCGADKKQAGDEAKWVLRALRFDM